MRVPRPAVGVLAIMRDKDYPAMLAGLAARCSTAWSARRRASRAASRPRSWPRPLRTPRQRAVGPRRRSVEAVADPHAALARARELAGADGSVLVGGSLYLLEDLRDVLAGGR